MQELIDLGGLPGDLRWDAKRGFVTIAEPELASFYAMDQLADSLCAALPYDNDDVPDLPLYSAIHADDEAEHNPFDPGAGPIGSGGSFQRHLLTCKFQHRPKNIEFFLSPDACLPVRDRAPYPFTDRTRPPGGRSKKGLRDREDVEPDESGGEVPLQLISRHAHVAVRHRKVPERHDPKASRNGTAE